ncbi:restriction endonuclease subunit S [Methanosphaera cuniculi]|uniref:restriction endonuclease subunit S n=1 Tax=Methanosphaera cuniculi TaxID=1077256 RepID=UPI0026DC7CCA|nr:restriction endonuclease subunit S [Methanosphaera cuniculi]
MNFKKLGEIAEIYNGLRITRYTNPENKEEKRVFTRKNKNNKLEYETQKISTVDPKYYSQKNDIILHLPTFECTLITNQTGIIIPQNYAIIRTKNGCDPAYLYNILISKQFKQKLKRLSEGTILHIVKLNYLKTIKIKMIPYEEQQKYGKLMMKIDKKIELEKEKIKKEELIKNSIIQNKIGEKYVKI